jgi:Clp amino terminal domain, pathogenicity island component
VTARSGTADTTYHPWTTYIHAREEARRRGDRKVGTDHLLLGLLHDRAIASALGTGLQAARGALDALDRQALGALGITPALEAPPLPMRQTPARPTLKAVLTGRLPLTPAAKRALAEAGKPMRRGRRITAAQVLLRLLDQPAPDPAAVLLAALGVDRAAVRGRLGAAPAA